MLLLGHIGITVFTASMIYLPALGAAIGVLLPDVIDKSLFLFGAPCGRFIAHSLFFFPITGVIAYGVTRNKKFAIAVAFGALLHLLEDMNDNVPFLYPFKEYTFFATCSSIKFVFTPFIISMEILGAFLLIFIFGYSKKFISFRVKIWRLIRNEQ